MNKETRVAIVTGSSRGIGRAVAKKLAGDGFKIIVHGKENESACRSVTEEIRQMGGDAIHVLADLGDRKDVDGLVGETRQGLWPHRCTHKQRCDPSPLRFFRNG